MPAWMTSELRELVCVPIASSASRMMTSLPASASSRAIARPTTPAPTTTTSTRSMAKQPLEAEDASAGERRGARHGPRRAVEQRADQRAEERAGGEADGADQRRGAAGGPREGRERERRGVRQHQRGAEEQQRERRHDRGPVRGTGPGERGSRRATREDQPAAAPDESRHAEPHHETACRPGTGDLAEHHAGEHPDVSADTNAQAGERKGGARHPREDRELAGEHHEQRAEEARLG